MDSWKKHLPDYELMRWDETSFDIGSTIFTKEAYENRKYAFVADYIRLWALHNHGGIYFDVDVEVLKPLDPFLSYKAFCGFEDETHISTAVIGSEKNGEWAKDQLDYYTDRHFIMPDGTPNTTTNVQIISKMMADQGFDLHNSRQSFKGIVEVFPQDFFSPKSFVSGKIRITENTCCIHHFSGSWLSPWQKCKKSVKYIIFKLGLYPLARRMLRKT